ncbi:uncharacterized protein LOC118448432 isoform X2 [Vespa mandarinia]|uniref:uncharacterized protein LOC118448432 isoform X2 n=1 Tax=Vespa mandarinia TaxID=7446 RepID=UPI0016108DC2|nr:uncharacterized protein LOC118448432 isoform X2 [Vespa mandarinia]
MMNEETIMKLMTPLTNDNGNGLYTHALLPGLFRAIVVKLNNNDNKYDDNNNCNNHRRKREDGITSKYANDSHETVSANRSRANVCPAYRFCVERNTAADMVTMDQEDSIISSELSTLRELLEPIKQTALKMKQLSQLKDEVPQTEIVCHQLGQTNDLREPEDVSSTCQLCGMKFDELMLSTNDCQVQQEGNIFEESDKVDGNISLRIISRPETETQYVVDDLLLNLIRQITSYILETSQKQQEELESEKKEVSLCRRTKKACSLYPDCLKPRPITTTDEEYSEVRNRSVQFQKCLQQEPSIFDDDSFSIQSYEFVRTMDVGCECKVERKHDELDGTNSN